MKICVIGTGYVGLTTAVGLASKGHEVIGVERRAEIVEAIRQGKCLFYEKGMEELLQKVLSEKKFSITSDLAAAVVASDISMICVGTPSREDGWIELGAIREASEAIGSCLKNKGAFHIVVVKSTVLPGTTLEVVKHALEEKSGKKEGKDFGIAMVPEFLREGTALSDFLEPDRIVIGVEDARTEKTLAELFGKSFSAPLVIVNTKTAEMIKYANNSFLALCISFSNEIAQICEKIGDTDAFSVMEAVAMDGRITTYEKGSVPIKPGIVKYMVPGCGFGGSCFPKDLSAISCYAKKLGISHSLIGKTLEINRTQTQAVVETAEHALGSAEGKAVAVLGTAFKPETDDTRSSPAMPIIQGLLEKKANVRVYDPKALENTRKIFGSKVEYCASAREALLGADLAVLVTRWKEFRSLLPKDFISAMKKPRILDCRGIYGRQTFSKETEYHRIGFKSCKELGAKKSLF